MGRTAPPIRTIAWHTSRAPRSRRSRDWTWAAPSRATATALRSTPRRCTGRRAAWRVSSTSGTATAGRTFTVGWYALAGYRVVPQLVELLGRVEQYDPSDQVATDRSTGYLVGLQYFIRGDDFKVMADYEVFREQGLQLDNNRGVVQLQARW